VNADHDKHPEAALSGTGQTRAPAAQAEPLEPYLLAELSSITNGIAEHMTHVLEQSARSSLLATSRDMSTAICDSTGAALALGDGFPVHTLNMGLTTRAVMRRAAAGFRPGDAYLNNSPYDGNTHMADWTIVVPVFVDDELLFFCTVRGHQADIGNSVPTTYYERARDIYDEGGLCFPCVKIQEDYADIEDLIRMCQYRIRVPEVWYGDYLAMIGAARVGERQLIELARQHGVGRIRQFCREWHEYGERRMVREIAKLPAGTWRNYSRHDLIPGLLDHDVEVAVSVTIDPSAGLIEVDFRGNGAPIDCGLNLCEATVLSAARTGIMNGMAPGIPICDGAMERIVVLMDDPGVVGKAQLPYSSSAATTNLANRALGAVQAVWSQIAYERGRAEGNPAMSPTEAVISGYDSRFGRRYVTQLLSGISGGMAVYGHDGLVNYDPSNGGMQGWNPVELVEQKYPVLYLEQELVPDSGGAGRWDGAPGTRCVIAAREDPVTFMYIGDGAKNAPRGFRGGLDGTHTTAHRRTVDGCDEPLPMCTLVELRPHEALVAECCSGGGYGEPPERDPERVLHRVVEGWISEERARDVYGVVLATEDGSPSVDREATAQLRRARQSQRMSPHGDERGDQGSRT
jgi:N-methylhydantoinase B